MKACTPATPSPAATKAGLRKRIRENLKEKPVVVYKENSPCQQLPFRPQTVTVPSYKNAVEKGRGKRPPYLGVARGSRTEKVVPEASLFSTSIFPL